MFNKVLVANRGEIAVRIIRACREMGIRTVAIYSEADRDSLHTLLADEAVCIGPASEEESYLDVDRIIAATVAMKADAVHPGYGFLSELPRFAELCERCSIRFIGPGSDILARVENKPELRKTMMAAGIPVVSENEKAVHTAETLTDDARHIEVQILADMNGNVVHLGERDCSIQLNHQKVLEESPCEQISAALRKKMGEAAVKAAKAAGYVNAGTVEFLLDKSGEFSFVEMNPRIQAEHPITETVTGIDLVKEQLRIAFGEKLSLKQEAVQIYGHAIECRVYAENPGTVTNLLLPGGMGVRVDTAVYNGYKVITRYDTLLLKLIVHDRDRVSAIAKMRSALGELIIEGVETNLDFIYDILNDESYQKGEVTTDFVSNHLPKHCK